jgi:outer membrane protein assembly factor BamB
MKQMMANCSKLLTITTGLLLLTQPVLAGAGQWNEFRGPNGSGVAVDARPPVQIDESTAAWSIDLLPGQSSPVLTDRLVIVTAVDGDRLVTLAYDKATGELAWRREAPECTFEKVHKSGSPASCSAYVDDERIYISFGSFGLLCYDHEGKDVWAKPIATPKSMYGVTTSPIVFGDNLIYVIDNDNNLPNSKLKQSKMIALNKKTGELIWETPRPYQGSGWSTPTLWEHDGGTEIVTLGHGRLCGYDAATGQEKWHVTGFSRETVARPILGSGYVFGAASMRGGAPDEKPDPEPYWEAVMLFDANGDGKLEPGEMTHHFTYPIRPDLKPGHSGFGFPMPEDPARRKGAQQSIFKRNDRNGDGYWTREEFIAGMSFGRRGTPRLLAVKPGGVGDVTESHVAWDLSRGLPEVPSPLFHDGLIYLVRDGGVLAALDAGNGRSLYRQRLGDAIGHYRASPVLAGGHLYFISQPGVLSVTTTGKDFKLVDQHDLGEFVHATPAIDRDTIYVRTETKLIAFRRQ